MALSALHFFPQTYKVVVSERIRKAWPDVTNKKKKGSRFMFYSELNTIFIFIHFYIVPLKIS